MKITKEQIKKLKPCDLGWRYFNEKERTEDLLELLLEINEKRPDWSSWLFTNLMTKKQCVQIAIFSAKEVIEIFEEKYPEDNRPRKAIEVAEKWLENSSKGNSGNAASAASAAASAAADAVASDTAYADAVASDAAYAASYAASAAASAASASYACAAVYAAAYAAAYAAHTIKKLQGKIIKQAVQILENNYIRERNIGV